MYELSVMTTKMAIIERWELVEFGLYLKTRMLRAGNHELICNQYDKLSYTYSWFFFISWLPSEICDRITDACFVSSSLLASVNVSMLESMNSES